MSDDGKPTKEQEAAALLAWDRGHIAAIVAREKAANFLQAVRVVRCADPRCAGTWFASELYIRKEGCAL